MFSITCKTLAAEETEFVSVIKQKDFIDSVEAALQYISYYHPKDFIDALYQAYLKEQNPAAKDAIGQILTNSKMF